MRCNGYGAPVPLWWHIPPLYHRFMNTGQIRMRLYEIGIPEKADPMRLFRLHGIAWDRVWYPEPDLNRHGQKPRDFKSLMSTNSIIRAKTSIII